MSVITDYPNMRPSVLMDFANSRRAHPLMTITRASTATCFGPDGKLRTVAANVPRMEFDPYSGKCRGLLVEEARTNMLTQSNNFADSAWSKSRSSVDSAADANGWWKVTEDATASATHITTRNISYAANTSYSMSVDVRAGTRRHVGIEIGGYSGQVNGMAVYVDLLTGAYEFSAAAINPDTRFRLIRLPEPGAWRICLTTTAAATVVGSLVFAVYMCSSQGVRSYDGDGASYLYVRNAQFEVGAASTSYIPTTTAQVTRAAEVPRITLAAVPALSCVIHFYGAFQTGRRAMSIVHPEGGAQVVAATSNTLSGGYLTGQTAVGGFDVGNSKVSYGELTKMAFSISSNKVAAAAPNGYGENTNRYFSPTTTPLEALIGVGPALNLTLNNCIERISFYYTELTQAQLIALAAS